MNRISLVDEQGHFTYGKYTTYLDRLNPLEFGRGIWGVMPRMLKNMRLKEWQAYMIGGKNHYILISTMDMKHFSVLKVLIYDKKSNQTWGSSQIHYNKKIKIAHDLRSSSVYACEAGTQIQVNHFLHGKKIEIGFVFKDALTGDMLSGYFETADVINDPLISVLPLKNQAGFYTHKQLISLQGYICVNDAIQSLHKNETTLVLDDQKVYYPYKTLWDWSTASGVIEGDYCGFTVSNVAAIKQTYNENAFWKNGKIHHVPDVNFSRNATSGNWTIVDEKGLVDMEFKPVAKHKIERNLFLASTKYEGPLGWFSGHIGSDTGGKLYVNSMFGMLERMYMRL